MNLFYDGFNSKLIETAKYDSVLEILRLKTQRKRIIPTRAIPFSKLNRFEDPEKDIIVFYEHDTKFRKFISVPQKFEEKLRKVNIISTPDCSLYRDMPLWMQIANIGVSRSVGYYLQQQGKYVIPNVRGGD